MGGKRSAAGLTAGQGWADSPKRGRGWSRSERLARLTAGTARPRHPGCHLMWRKIRAVSRRGCYFGLSRDPLYTPQRVLLTRLTTRTPYLLTVQKLGFAWPSTPRLMIPSSTTAVLARFDLSASWDAALLILDTESLSPSATHVLSDPMSGGVCARSLLIDQCQRSQMENDA